MYLACVPFAESKLTSSRVKVIKKRIIAKESLRKLAEEYGVGYMTIYKIAIGQIWKTVEPRGRLIGTRDYTSTRTIDPIRCQKIALVKIRKRISFAKIGRRIGVSEATARRAADYGYAILGKRLQQHTVRGTLKQAQAKLQLTDEEVEDLIRAGAKKGLPDWIRKAVEGDDDEDDDEDE